MDTSEWVRQIATLPPADQFRIASLVAENVGYMLVPEPEHPDSPHKDEAGPPTKWLAGRLRDLAREQVADPKTTWIGERIPEHHICWIAADLLEAQAP